MGNTKEGKPGGITECPHHMSRCNFRADRRAQHPQRRKGQQDQAGVRRLALAVEIQRGDAFGRGLFGWLRSLSPYIRTYMCPTPVWGHPATLFSHTSCPAVASAHILPRVLQHSIHFKIRLADSARDNAWVCSCSCPLLCCILYTCVSSFSGYFCSDLCASVNGFFFKVRNLATHGKTQEAVGVWGCLSCGDHFEVSMLPPPPTPPGRCGKSGITRYPPGCRRF